MSSERSPSVEISRLNPIEQRIYQYINSPEFTTRAKSENSQCAYRSDLTHFRKFCQDHGIRFLGQLQPESLDTWIAELENAKFKTSTIARKVASLKGFLRWARGQELLARDFTAELPKFKIPERSFQVLNREQIRALIDAAKGKKSLRDAALISIALKTGARVEEIVSRNVEDVVQSASGQVGVRFNHAKKGGGRVVPVDSETRAIIKDYLSEGELKPDRPLFPGGRGRNHLTRQGFWWILKDYGVKIRVPDLDPTMLRDTFVANFAGSSRKLAKVLGIEKTSGSRLRHWAHN